MVSLLLLKSSYLAKAAQVTISATRLRREKRLNQMPSDLRPDRPAAEAQDVEVVVLDALSSREMILQERRANIGDLVRADASADAAPAQGDLWLLGVAGSRVGRQDRAP